MDARSRAIDGFVARYGHEPALVARAPGRVNLIGEHTDYNDGFVLPMALPHATWIAASPNGDPRVRLVSDGYEPAEFDLPVTDRSPEGWSAYPRGVAWALSETGVAVRGWDGAIATDVPLGAGLSSSAAIEVATAHVFAALAAPPEPLDAETIARAAQRVENELLGLPSGIMDQLISASAVEGHATLIDCRDLTRSPVPIPDGTTVVVMDTATRRELTGSPYADRRAACYRVAAALDVPMLRDATVEQVAAVDVDPVDRRRALHVVEENRRTLDAAEAMRRSDAPALGRLMDASHASLRDRFEVSCAELDQIVDAARRAPGCIGARMTGGGFGGCAVALVETEATAAFAASVEPAYTAASGRTATLYPVLPSAGASVEQLG